jgi:hypothetical protein
MGPRVNLGSAVKNPLLRPKPGGAAGGRHGDRQAARDRNGIWRLQRCDAGEEQNLAGKPGVSAEDAAKEWAVNVIRGMIVIPSGTWGVNRAQAAECSYCAGGG